MDSSPAGLKKNTQEQKCYKLMLCHDMMRAYIGMDLLYSSAGNHMKDLMMYQINEILFQTLLPDLLSLLLQ